ncbi:DUF4091 domain-containing protein, partial [bacterium]|nr:DUF4091 domain-containing protein [bacterium]
QFGQEEIKFKGTYGKEVNLSVCRNEYEGFQLVIIPFEKDIKGINFTCTDLLNKKTGEKILAENIEVFLVGYISTAGRKTKYKTRYLGDWPDPLLSYKPFDIRKNEVQPVWVNVYVPPGMPAGEYIGSIKLSPKNAEVLSLGLKVRVWDFELPKSSSFSTAISMNEWHVANYYKKLFPSITSFSSPQVDEILKRYYQFLLQHRMNPCNLYDSCPPHCPTKEQLSYCINLGMNAHCIDCLVGGWSGSAEQFEKKYYNPSALKLRQKPWKEYYEFAKGLGFEDKLFVHAFDEIFAAKDIEKQIILFKRAADSIKEVAPEVKIECITYVLPELIGVVDIWCPSFSMFEKEREKYEERLKAGDELWLYCCLGSPEEGSAPSFVLESEASDLRIIPWICHKYGVTGFLYYAITHYKYNCPAKGKAWPEKPWNPIYIDGYNGEAVLIYPGVDGHPVSSIRMENLRDGIEDYDYLVILSDLVERLKGKKVSDKISSLVKEAKEILKVNNIVENSKSYTHSPQSIYKERERMANLILKLKRESG